MQTEMNELQLIRLLKEHPSNGIEQLINTYSGLVSCIMRNVLNSLPVEHDMDEYVSGVFIEFYEKLDRIDLSKGSIKAYIATIAKRRAIDIYNKTIFTEMYRSKLCRYAVSVAAVLILAVSCILLLNNDTVYAALTRFFSFIPGVGVVEVDDESNFNRQYILCETLPSVGDDKLYVEVKNATAVDGKLEVIYYTQLIAIPEIEINILANSPQEMDSDITDLIELYKKYGYDHYFTIQRHDAQSISK